MRLQVALLPWAAAQLCPTPLHLSTTWSLLGPFQVGTREAEWGADPLERFGGFRNLNYSTNSTFRSSLPLYGAAGWNKTTLDRAQTSLNASKGTVNVEFSNVDWIELQSVYGWAGLQFQAWARGSLYICGEDDTTVTMYLEKVGEFWLDGMQYFGGDFYSYRRAPVVLKLAPGAHTIEVRVTHDIRNFGASVPPVVSFTIEVIVSKGELVAVPELAVLPDLAAGRVVGEFGSVPLRNEDDVWVEVLGVVAKFGTEVSILDGDVPFRIAPGQTRPARLTIGMNTTALDIAFRYRRDGDSRLEYRWANVTMPLNILEDWFMPQKYTFLHPSGIVSYAVLRPPSPSAPCAPEPNNSIPILLALHGAGVEADDPQSEGEYDALPDLCSWLVIPSGVTSWSGDDWHIWGFSDVEAAVSAIPLWMQRTGWKRQGVDLEKWVVSGHSNGGQGAWYTLTHRNDKVIAAAPLSGYLSIPAYVPYQMWHESDPWKIAMVLASMNSYRHELLVKNMAGTPILQQHGQQDDNVPVFHSRRMSQLIGEIGWRTDYWEIPGEGHWWDGVMTWCGLPEFLRHHLEEVPDIPPLPQSFSVVVANPSETTSRGGVFIDQLINPEKLGRISVERLTSFWRLETFNIRRFHFCASRMELTGLEHVTIDGQFFPVSSVAQFTGSYIISKNGGWSWTSDSEWKGRERSGRQLGSLSAILNSNGQFSILIPSLQKGTHDFTKSVAMDIARNLYQYFAADSVIVERLEVSDGNVILLGLPWGSGIPAPESGFPITKSDDCLVVTDAFGRIRRYKLEPGLGVAFIYPLANERLLLALWGMDEAGLRAVARLLPLRTGVGQPDLVVVGKEASWSGAAGAVALGMFDADWRLSAASFLSETVEP